MSEINYSVEEDSSRLEVNDFARADGQQGHPRRDAALNPTNKSSHVGTLLLPSTLISLLFFDRGLLRRLNLGGLGIRRGGRIGRRSLFASSVAITSTSVFCHLQTEMDGV
jgi:hypothetical protein